MTESTRKVAERLVALSDDELARLFAARGVPPNVPWRDFFDAADTLTSDASIAAVLAAIPSPVLDALLDRETDAATPGADADSARADQLLADLLLADDEGRPLLEVLRALAPVPHGEVAAHRLAPPSTDDAAATAAERAFTSIDALGDVLLDALHSPLNLLGSGGLAAADRRRLGDETQRPDDLDALLAVGMTAGLLAREERALLPTALGEDWLRRPSPERWLLVARALRADLPAPLRGGTDPAEGWAHPDAWESAFPADPAWTARARDLRQRALTWGLLAADGSEPPWSLALRTDDEGAVASALASAFPDEVDRIYLQNDLTAISPGPLAAALDVRLRGIARRESHAQASSYRFTAETIVGALSEGETDESILEFLAGLSLTGVPQPLEYLVRTTAQRYGSIRVGADEYGRALVTADRTVLDTLAIDQSLRPLGLVRTLDGAALGSRVSRDVVLWSLVDARYPAVAVDAEGQVETLRRHRLAGPAAATVAPLALYADVLERLRSVDATDADAAWLGRELDAAVRARAVIEVDVELPGGETRAFVLEASGLGGGRLRGRERGTDVERTLPVSSIRAVRRV